PAPIRQLGQVAPADTSSRVGQRKRPHQRGREQVVQGRLISLPSLVRQRQRLLLQDIIYVVQVSVSIETQLRRQLPQVVAEEGGPRDEDQRQNGDWGRVPGRLAHVRG